MKRLLRHTSNPFALTALTVAILCSGCSWSIGEKSGTDGPKSAQPTKGSELIDLKSAYDRGALSQSEYEAQRARILERR